MLFIDVLLRLVAVAILLVVASHLAKIPHDPPLAVLAILVSILMLMPLVGHLINKWVFRGNTKISVTTALIAGFVVAPAMANFFELHGDERVAYETRRAESDAKRRKERIEQEIADSRADREKKCNDTLGAFVMSQAFVKERLLTPSTAKFPYITSDGVSSVSNGDCRFLVMAYVDAQNVTGATIRQPYAAELTLNPNSDRWSLDDIVIGR